MTTIRRLACGLLVSAPSTAFARPTDTVVGTTTPAVVEGVRPETSTFQQREYRKGNLRLSIMCADTWATPDSGLSLTVDGATLDAQRFNGRWSFYSESDVDGDVDSGELWLPTDVGYLVAPGRHHVQIDAPGCAPSAFDMDAYSDHTQHAEGRLEISDSSLMGPVGAPNGWGMMFGAWYGALPAGSTTNSVFHQTASFDPNGGTTGLALSSSLERRHLVIASDASFANGATSGHVSGVTSGTNEPMTQAFTGTRDLWTNQLRIGARVPLRVVSVEAGSGVGLQWWTDSGTLVGSKTSGLFAPSGIDASFYLPVWASATFKPACDWGVQVIGQYDVHPTSTDNDGVELMGGMLYQPSASCSEPAGVRVSPR